MGWGAINAALNGLVRDGVIAAFKTNLAEPATPFGLHVTVTAPGADDDAGVEEVRRKVLAALDELGEDATVTVNRSGQPLRPDQDA
ncbi:MAG TPA: hypothetical protein VHL98_20780 [Microvirga sp.]|jgi:hypothetical protein|nr:hypothetical protein [Microvirga sp.]